MSSTAPATASGTFAIGGDLTVHRLGYGAMRITGPGIWGAPADHDEAVRVLRRAVELGVDFIDTADSYGPFVSEDLIREALHSGGADPYDGVTVATKAGLIRTGPDRWHQLGRPEYLRFACEMSLRRLDVERIELFQLHRIDDQVPEQEQFGVLAELRDEGKIRHVGLSEVGVDELARAQQVLPVATVQNRYNLLDRGSQDVLERCERDGIGFIPWFPIATGDLARAGGPLDELASRTGATPSQLALAWLLRTSPVQLPIPGTSSVAHLEENVAASEVELSDDDVAALDALADGHGR
ncbi:aldo/keto reductase [Egicoccus halophilus]|uniref:Oxidoreductase n=1 Tax=Egicoccus halophilus TaxID=1670830 RepID=A0A8J3ADM8_9ACTN|nr:aldo/keto reductase [Egicoccus halophilus]GGI09666.1 oxidoreductase [Egicoccus halophilus]